MFLVLTAIFLTLLVFVFCILASLLLERQRIQPNYRLHHKRYSYRSEPHADQTTEYPNRLDDNRITDI